MDGKTVTGIGLGALLLGGVAIMSPRGRAASVVAQGDASRWARARFSDQMRSAWKAISRGRSRGNLLRAKMHLERANENLVMMRALEDDDSDHGRYFDEWEDAVEELSNNLNKRGMRPLPI